MSDAALWVDERGLVMADIAAPRWAWRLVSPAGFALVFACLWLPFLFGPTRSQLPPELPPIFEPSFTYSGVDLTLGGSADLVTLQWQPDQSLRAGPISDRDLFGRPQPRLRGGVYGTAVIILLGAGLLAALLPVARVRAIIVAGAALFAALALLAVELTQRRAVAATVLPDLLGTFIGVSRTAPLPVQYVSFRYGFYLAMGLLIVIGFAHVAIAVPGRTRVPEEPALT